METYFTQIVKNLFYLIIFIGLNVYSQTKDEFFAEARLQEREEHYYEAIKYYSKAIDLDKRYLEAYLHRADCEGLMNDYNSAIVDYTMVIVLDKTHSKAYYGRSVSNSQLDNYREAVSDMNKAIEFNIPTDYYPYNLLGVFKVMLKDQTGAILDFKKEIQINPNLPDPYFNMAIAKIDLGQLENACIDFNKAKELGHPRAEILINKHCKL